MISQYFFVVVVIVVLLYKYHYKHTHTHTQSVVYVFILEKNILILLWHRYIFYCTEIGIMRNCNKKKWKLRNKSIDFDVFWLLCVMFIRCPLCLLFYLCVIYKIEKIKIELNSIMVNAI